MKLTDRALAKWRQEQTELAAHLRQRRSAPATKQLALELYGGCCAGDCGTTEATELFFAHRDELLDASARILHRGKDYRLSAQWHLALHEYLVQHGGPKAYAPFCWACFKRVGRTRRRSAGVVHWKDQRAIRGFNCE